MGDLIAVGYEDEITAGIVAEEVKRVADDLTIEPDAVAVIVRDREAQYMVTTNHHAVGTGASYGMIWDPLFGLLFFVPVFGMAVGADLGALIAKVEKVGIEMDFQEGIRSLLKPGTSALFIVVDNASPDLALEALSGYGGTVLQSSLSQDAERELQDALHGQPVAA